VKKIVKLGLLFKTFTGVMIFAIGFVFADWFASLFLQRPDLTFYIRIASLGILFQVVFTTATSVFVGLDRTEYNAVATNIQAVAKTVVSIALVLLGLSVTGALIGNVASFAVGGAAGISMLFITMRGKNVFPKSVKKRYVSDMTRTVVKGKASKEIKKMFETVLQVRNAAIDAMKSGVPGKEMQVLAYDMFEKAGYQTTRGGKQVTKGYNHGLGHGVGLEVHEGPGMGELSDSLLENHNVVTVEPGLYDPEIGGVRIEDVAEVTKKGCRNLTEMEICLEI
jgi:hypothetical protein